jgi:hypothetical protein
MNVVVAVRSRGLVHINGANGITGSIYSPAVV